VHTLPERTLGSNFVSNSTNPTMFRSRTILFLLVAAAAAAAVAAQNYTSDDCEDGGGTGGGTGGGGNAPPDTPGGICSANNSTCPYPCPAVDGVRRCIPELPEGAACSGLIEAGVCKTDLLCLAGTCAAAAWDEECGENGRRCADGLLCVKPPNSRGGGFPSVCFKVVKSGDACTSYLNRNEPGKRTECEKGLRCLDERAPDGQLAPKCGVFDPNSPGSVTNATLGESCSVLPCNDFDWCNPATKICEDPPAEGSPCAQPPTTNGLVCLDLQGLFCDKSGGGAGVCRNQTAAGQVCNSTIGSVSCPDQSDCITGVDGTARCLQGLAIGYFCDKPEYTCWRKGYKPNYNLPEGWTQDMRCEAGVCAADIQGGELTLCESGQTCAAGLVCSVGQDGRQRCMGLAPEGPGSYNDACRIPEPTDSQTGGLREYGRKACREGTKCVLSKADNDFDRGYCYTVTGVGRGQRCDLYGGTGCVEKDSAGTLICESYSNPISSSAEDVCVGRAENGGACNGNSFDSCLAAFPASDYCDENNKCVRDVSNSCSQDGGCGAGLQCVDVDKVKVCVDYQRGLGQTCEQSEPVFGIGLWKLKCKPEFTCFSRSEARFNVAGVCSTVVAPGQRCAPAENLECPGACINGTCQSVNTPV
jgi:hypothetical protein